MMQTPQGVSKSRQPLFQRRLILVFIGAVFLFIFSSVLYGNYRFLRFEGDTRALLMGTQAMATCLKQGQGYCPEIVHFPISQYIPALFFHICHFSLDESARALGLLNVISFLGIIICSFWYLQKKRSLSTGLLSTFILFTGPLVWYTRSSFYETTSGLITLLFTLACLSRSSPMGVAFLLVLAGITKEVALPFLLFIVGLSYGPEILIQYKKNKTIPQLIALVPALLIGSCVTVGLNTAFNYWRFNSPFNLTTLNPQLIVPTLKQHCIYFFALLFSPNGGLFVFWFSFLLLLLYFILSSRTQKNDLFKWNGTYQIGILTLLLGLVFGFSKWFAPFGWLAWGPRLLLPWIPSLIVLILSFSPLNLDATLNRISFKSIKVLGAALLVEIMSLPQLMAIYTDTPFSKLFSPNLDCGYTAYITQPDAYYDCLNHLSWPKHVFILWETLYETTKNPALFRIGFIYLIFLSTLLWLIVKCRQPLKSILPERKIF